MRIDRLDLIAYGPFSDTSLDLSTGDVGLHIIYGDNEAGKSTSLRALIAWLFGIPARTSDNHRHAYDQLRVGGQLRLSTGRTLEFVRRKGRKDTLLAFGADTTLDDAELRSFLPREIDEGLFTRLYGIDHGRLVAGGQELLNQSGDLGQALFSAAVGTASLRDVLAELQNGADDLYRPRASTKPVNKAISSFKEVQKRIKQSSLPVAEWKRQQKDLSDLEVAIVKVEHDIDARCKEKSRLDRLNRVTGALAERISLIERLAVLDEVVLLPSDFGDKHRAACDKLQTALEAKAKYEAQLSRLREEKQALRVRDELLDNEAAILAMYKELGAVEKTIKDRPQQDGKRRHLRNEAANFLKGVRPDIDLDGADALRPLLNNKRSINGLARKYDVLNQRKEKAEATLKESGDDCDSLRKERAALPAPLPNLGDLKAAIASARKAGDVEQRLSDTQKLAAEARGACDRELARLGRFSGTLEALTEVAMPLPETLDVFERKLDEAGERLRDTARKAQEFEDQLRQAEQNLNALLLAGPVPSVAELQALREQRDAEWRRIRQRYIDHDAVDAESKADFPETDVAAAYEQLVTDADSTSDQLRIAADTVAKRANLEAEIENLNVRLTTVRVQIEAACAAEEHGDADWKQIWKPLGITPGSPREMKQWLLRVEQLRESNESANAISGDARKLADTHDALKDIVARRISTFDDRIDLDAMNLEAMISLCEQRVEQTEITLERERRVTDLLRDGERRLKRTRDELRTIEGEQAAWSRDWREAIDGLGVKPDVHPEHATETFERMEAFFNTFDKSEELRKRIYGMDEITKAFDKRVFAFADAIGLDRDGQESTTIVAQLHRDLSEARDALASLRKIQEQEKRISAEIADADITIQAATEQLNGLRAQAGVETNDALAAAGENSQKKRGLREKLDLVEQEITRNGDGLSISELEQDASETDVDTIDGELEKISLEIKELQQNRDALRDQRLALRNDIQTKDGRAAAAEASEEAEQHLATAVSGVENYLRLRIAALILEQRIEDYRQKNQAPVLARAGVIFSRLTLGSYAGLRDELDAGGKPILLGVRPDDMEVPVDGMSDGTRDQLFLALRLATLEQHQSKGEPMPLVMDDILLSFDDKRTRICLAVLAELAARTQVLLFTHHRRVIELAETCSSPAGIYIHELA